MTDAPNSLIVTTIRNALVTNAPGPQGPVGPIQNITLNAPFANATNFTLNGSTATGTQTFQNQSANTILAGPASGAAATPAYRTLVSNDLPPIIDKGGQVLNALAYGLVNNGSTLNDTAWTTLVAALPTTGGTIYFPPGTYNFAQPINFAARRGIRLLGAGAATNNAPATRLLYTATDSSSFINLQSCAGSLIENLTLQWSSVSFSGTIIDLREQTANSQETSSNIIRGVTITPVGSAGAAPCVLMQMDGSYGTLCEQIFFSGGQYAVKGLSSQWGFSNCQAFIACNFGRQTTASVLNPGTAWLFASCIFEPNTSGIAAAITQDSDGLSKSHGLDLASPWIGDSNSSPGTWIKWSGTGLSIRGGQMSLGDNTTGVQITANNCAGIRLENIYMPGGAVSGKLIDFAATTGHAGFSMPAVYAPNVVTRINGTIPSGAVYDNGSVPFLDSPNFTGNSTAVNLTASGSISAAIATFTNPLGNLMSSAQADLEGISSITGVWSALSDSSVALTSAVALHGTQSLALTASDGTATTIGAYNTTFIAVTPSTQYTGMFYMRAPVGTPPRRLFIQLVGFDNSGTQTTVFASFPSTIRDTSTGWTQIIVTGTTDSNTVKARVYVKYLDSTNIPVNETHYIDCISISRSTATIWQDPAQGNSSINIINNIIAQQGSNGANDVCINAQNSGIVRLNSGPGAGTGGMAIGKNRIQFATAAPTTDTWAAGDVVWNTAVASGQPEGWRCTVAGTPGTWLPMANLP